MEQETSVKVAVRIRPLVEHEINQHCGHCIQVVPGEPQVAVGNDHIFTFDYAFGLESSQTGVYDECVSNLVDATFEGFNATILAYGQTGSGKTFTMGSASNLRIREEHQGIIPRVIHHVFETIHQKETENENCSYRVRIQFLEIYGDEIRDLLDPSTSTKVAIREHPTGEVYVAGAREELVTSAEEMMMALERGSLSRTTGSTLMNQSSSRSHAIFTVLLESTNRTIIAETNTNDVSNTGGISASAVADENTEINNIQTPSNRRQSGMASMKSLVGTTEIHTCKFHFVDLAGSERAKRTGAEGTRMREGIDINKGLLVLGNVISALGDEKKKGKSHVPYRDSKLTRLLQDSLGGNSKTVMICCVSPADNNLNESLNALRYANRARNIKNKPVVNRDPTSMLIAELKHQVKSLASELLAVHRWMPVPNTNWSPFSWVTPVELLEEFASTTVPGDEGRSNLRRTLPLPLGTEVQMNRSVIESSGSRFPSTVLNKNDNKKALSKEEKNELDCLRVKLMDSDSEVIRLSDQVRKMKLRLDQVTELGLIDRTERDFYRMKWQDADPEAKILQPQVAAAIKGEGGSGGGGGEGEGGQTAVARTLAEYVREIAKLKQELVDAKQAEVLGSGMDSSTRRMKALKKLGPTTSPLGDIAEDGEFDEFDSMSSLLEGELTSSVTKVIARTQEQLKEEQKRLKEIQNENKDKDSALLIDDSISCSDDNEDAKELEEADREFQRRQKMMTAEVVDLGESIQLKQQLVQHLKDSTVQYAAMKTFYETKLQALSQEMQEKEEEMDKLQQELAELANRSKTGPAAAPGAEDRLKERLLLKEEELKALRSRQIELSHLSKVQTRHVEQIAKLSNEIENMKKSKVTLARNMQSEKKAHMQALALKAREIEKLKRELQASLSELQKLGRDKEKTDSRGKEKDAKKRLASYGSHGLHTESVSLTTRRAQRTLRISPKAHENKLPTEDDMKTKRWIDQRIAEISVKEELADSLRKHCSEQITLVHKRDSLVAEKKKLTAAMESGQGPTALSELYELDDQIALMETQLTARGTHIADMQATLGAGEDASTACVNLVTDALELLTQGSPVHSASIASELLRLTFELLVLNRRRLEQATEASDLASSRLKVKEEELEDLKGNLSAMQRLHDRDLTRALQEYEEKLTGLFENSNMVRVIQSSNREEQQLLSIRAAVGALSDDVRAYDSPSGMGKLRSRSPNEDGVTVQDLEANALAMVPPTPPPPTPQAGMEQFKMMLSLSTERNSVLKSQLSKEVAKTQDLQERLAEVRSSSHEMKKAINEGQRTIKFLEDECRMLREMADEFKARLKQSGGEIGQAIIRQVKAAEMLIRGDVVDADGDDDDDDTQSVLGEFSTLADEIQRTGVVPMHVAPVHAAGATHGPHQSRKHNIFDRLANPSSYTGTSKNLFLQDLETKRARVLQIKREEAETKRRMVRHQSKSPSELSEMLGSTTVDHDDDDSSLTSSSSKPSSAASAVAWSQRDRRRQTSVVKSSRSAGNLDTASVSSSWSSSGSISTKSLADTVESVVQSLSQVTDGLIEDENSRHHESRRISNE